MPKISLTRVREIVNEEIYRASSRRGNRLSEADAGPDHKTAATVVSAASKLLAALEGFDKATKDLPAVRDTTQENIDGLRKSLAHMLEAPTSYAKLPAGKKIVKLRAQNAQETL